MLIKYSVPVRETHTIDQAAKLCEQLHADARNALGQSVNCDFVFETKATNQARVGVQAICSTGDTRAAIMRAMEYVRDYRNKQPTAALQW